MVAKGRRVESLPICELLSIHVTSPPGDGICMAFFLRQELIVLHARTIANEARPLTKPWPVAG